MTRKKYKARIEGTSIIVTRVISDDWRDLKDALQNHYSNRVKQWRTLAEKYGVGDMLDQAKQLLDLRGQPEDPERFNRLVDHVVLTIAMASNEQEIIPQAVHGGKFKQKEERMDPLSSLIWSTMLALMSEPERTRLPTARELWQHLPCEDPVQEKDPDDANGPTIYWLKPSGKDKTTPFKSFQNRYTTLRKKFNKIHS